MFAPTRYDWKQKMVPQAHKGDEKENPEIEIKAGACVSQERVMLLKPNY